MMTVSPTFFETMDIPILAGRGFRRSDTADAPGVVMLNAAAAAEYFPGENALGQRLGFSRTENANLEVVGILGDTKYSSVRDAAPPTMYRPHTQSPLRTATVELRAEANPQLLVPAVRASVEQIDPEVAVSAVSTQVEQVEERFSEERLFALAYSLFGGLALLLAAIGLFGLMAYSVEHRTNEIGIRVALGAQRMDVARSVAWGYALLLGIGVALGLGGAWAAVRLIESLLYDVAPTDPAIMILAVVVVLLVSAIAMVLPLRRALGVNPMVALRYE
jgi:predicted permease